MQRRGRTEGRGGKKGSEWGVGTRGRGLDGGKGAERVPRGLQGPHGVAGASSEARAIIGDRGSAAGCRGGGVWCKGFAVHCGRVARFKVSVKNKHTQSEHWAVIPNAVEVKRAAATVA